MFVHEIAIIITKLHVKNVEFEVKMSMKLSTPLYSWNYSNNIFNCFTVRSTL